MKRQRLFWLLVLIGLMAQGCGQPVAARKIRVVATIAPLADWSRQVGGDRVEVTQLVPAGTNPRTYTPTPDDLTKIANAEVVLLNGFGLEPWLDEFLDRRNNQQVIMLDVSRFVGPALETVMVPKNQSPLAAEMSEEERAMQANQGTMIEVSRPIYSPYIWLDPSTARQTVNLIAQTLTRVDADGWPQYRQNAARCNAEIENLDSSIQRAVDRLPDSAFDDLTDFLHPFRSHFNLARPVATSVPLLNEPPRPALVDVMLPMGQRLELLGSRQPAAIVDPLNNDQYLVLMQTLTQQVVQGLEH